MSSEKISNEARCSNKAEPLEEKQHFEIKLTHSATKADSGSVKGAAVLPFREDRQAISPAATE